MPEQTQGNWKKFLARYPDAHVLQTSQWGQLKSAFGWRPIAVVEGAVGAQVLFKSLPFGFTIAYIPKGPVGSDWLSLWPQIDALCKKNKAIFLKVEPDFWEDQFNPETLHDHGFHPSKHGIQPRQTITLDISEDEEQILARMKQKTRYNIRLAGRKDVKVETSADLEVFQELMEDTGDRGQFGVHSLAYYRQAYQLFHPAGLAEIFLARYDGQPLAALMVFVRGKRAWYFYGASNNLHRNRMPTYLLQWEAIRWAKAKGCLEYDLWGVPDADQETLESQFKERHDGLWGVYRFKRGFGGVLKRSAGAWDRVYNPLLYWVYQAIMGRRN